MNHVPRRDGAKKGFRFGRKKEESNTTKEQIGAMAKAGTLRSAGAKPTDREKQDNFYDRIDVKHEASHGYSARPDYNGQELTRGEKYKRAAKQVDKDKEKE